MTKFKIQFQMKLRIANKNDWSKIIEIYNQATVTGFSNADTEPVTVKSRKNWFIIHNPDEYPIFIVEKNAKIIGWCSLSPYRHGRKALRTVAEISFYLDNQFKGQGIGTWLVRKVIHEAKTLGFRNLLAILLDNNEASIRLLRKLGFEKWGHLPEIALFKESTSGQYIYGLKIN